MNENNNELTEDEKNTIIRHAHYKLINDMRLISFSDFVEKQKDIEERYFEELKSKNDIVVEKIYKVKYLMDDICKTYEENIKPWIEKGFSTSGDIFNLIMYDKIFKEVEELKQLKHEVFSLWILYNNIQSLKVLYSHAFKNWDTIDQEIYKKCEDWRNLLRKYGRNI